MYMYETKEQIDKLRNQLIEIVDEAKNEYSHDCTDRSETEYIVEGLLDMGVILPPCNIKNIVYEIDRRLCANGRWAKTIVERSADGIDTILITDRGKYIISLSQLGKNLFLSREEAEKALKAMEGNMSKHVCTNCRNNRICNHNEYGFENCDNWTPLTKYGKWKLDIDSDEHFCSACGEPALCEHITEPIDDEDMDGEYKYIGEITNINEFLTDYCPNCGIKMKGRD